MPPTAQGRAREGQQEGRARLQLSTELKLGGHWRDSIGGRELVKLISFSCCLFSSFPLAFMFPQFCKGNQFGVLLLVSLQEKRPPCLCPKPAGQWLWPWGQDDLGCFSSSPLFRFWPCGSRCSRSSGFSDRAGCLRAHQVQPPLFLLLTSLLPMFPVRPLQICDPSVPEHSLESTGVRYIGTWGHRSPVHRYLGSWYISWSEECLGHRRTSRGMYTQEDLHDFKIFEPDILRSKVRDFRLPF